MGGSKTGRPSGKGSKAKHKDGRKTAQEVQFEEAVDEAIRDLQKTGGSLPADHALFRTRGDRGFKIVALGVPARVPGAWVLRKARHGYAGADLYPSGYTVEHDYYSCFVKGAISRYTFSTAVRQGRMVFNAVCHEDRKRPLSGDSPAGLGRALLRRVRELDPDRLSRAESMTPGPCVRALFFAAGVLMGGYIKYKPRTEAGEEELFPVERLVAALPGYKALFESYKAEVDTASRRAAPALRVPETVREYEVGHPRPSERCRSNAFLRQRPRTGVLDECRAVLLAAAAAQQQKRRRGEASEAAPPRKRLRTGHG